MKALFFSFTFVTYKGNVYHKANMRLCVRFNLTLLHRDQSMLHREQMPLVGQLLSDSLKYSVDSN